MGLFNTLNDAKDEQALARRDGLLAELRALAQAHPEDAAVREWLAKALAKTLHDAADEETPELEGGTLRHRPRPRPPTSSTSDGREHATKVTHFCPTGRLDATDSCARVRFAGQGATIIRRRRTTAGTAMERANS